VRTRGFVVTVGVECVGLMAAVFGAVAGMTWLLIAGVTVGFGSVLFLCIANTVSGR
jgi:thioredoxin reductase